MTCLWLWHGFTTDSYRFLLFYSVLFIPFYLFLDWQIFFCFFFLVAESYVWLCNYRMKCVPMKAFGVVCVCVCVCLVYCIDRMPQYKHENISLPPIWWYCDNWFYCKTFNWHPPHSTLCLLSNEQCVFWSCQYKRNVANCTHQDDEEGKKYFFLHYGLNRYIWISVFFFFISSSPLWS